MWNLGVQDQHLVDASVFNCFILPHAESQIEDISIAIFILFKLAIFSSTYVSSEGI